MSTARGRVSLSSGEARRIALRAQGFGDPRTAAVTGRHIARLVGRLGVIQIDSVNVVVRSHYLPVFSRLGAYDRELLERAAYDPTRRTLFEYWGHEASLLPLALHPLFRWRMERAARGEATWSRIAAFARERRREADAIVREIDARGPLAAGDFAAHVSTGGGWWAWSDVKIALEYLFWSGRITTATRRNFERVYDLTERVLPAALLAQPTPSEADAQRALLAIAARALGIASASDLRDYFRLGVEANARIGELIESGELLPVAVDGIKPALYLARGATVPRRIDACALVSPFDSLVWERARDRRLFGFDYRLEIYTPAHKRVHGYYVLPFVYGDRIVSRVDLKARRDEGVLDVIAIHHEAGLPDGARAALQTELERLASWLGLGAVAIRPRARRARA